MLIDRIYQKVKSLANTDVRGNLKPAKFNLFLHDAIQSRYEDYLYEINRLETRKNKGLGSNLTENLPDKVREKVLHYLSESDISGTDLRYPLPDDVVYLDEVQSSTGITFDSCRNSKEFNIIKSQATATYPIYNKIGQTIRTSHDLNDLTVTYLRKPKFPKWTYQEFDGVEFFNPGSNDFEDADIHSSEENMMVIEVLKRAGLNLKEQDLQAAANNEDNTETQNNNLT